MCVCTFVCKRRRGDKQHCLFSPSLNATIFYYSDSDSCASDFESYNAFSILETMSKLFGTGSIEMQSSLSFLFVRAIVTRVILANDES